MPYKLSNTLYTTSLSYDLSILTKTYQIYIYFFAFCNLDTYNAVVTFVENSINAQVHALVTSVENSAMLKHPIFHIDHILVTIVN
jgi:hypothetical protein